MIWITMMTYDLKRNRMVLLTILVLNPVKISKEFILALTYCDSVTNTIQISSKRVLLLHIS